MGRYEQVLLVGLRACSDDMNAAASSVSAAAAEPPVASTGAFLD